MSNLLENIYIIEDGYNTNYISCLILTMFLDKNIIYKSFLLNDTISIENIYLQELIKSLISDFKNYKIINGSKQNYLRNYLYFKGFQSFNTILNNNSIEELYNFLFEKLNIPKIEFLNILDNNVESINYINLIINDPEINIKKLLEYNLQNKLLNNIPHFLAIKINKFNENYMCDIQKKITFNSVYNYTNQIDIRLIWVINSIICFEKELNIYFSFLQVNNNWYIINQLNIPSIQKIHIKNYENIIKLKAIFVIYQFSEN
jgi:hypothetical protein